LILFSDTDVKVAHCSNVACTAVTTSTVLASAGSLFSGSIAVAGHDGLPRLAFNAQTFPRYALCSDVACTQSQVTPITGLSSPGFFMSLTIGLDENAIITFLDSATAGAAATYRVAWCPNASCTGSTIVPFSSMTLPTPGPVKPFTSPIVIGADGLPLIAYFGTEGGMAGVYVRHCSTPACTSSDLVPIAQTAAANGWHGSMTLMNDGLPSLLYSLNQSGIPMTIVHCGNNFCSPEVARRK
jgi:hypothetical protein